jgi:hypothetical protein
MIFSGDSSLGKSYSAFLTYYLINLVTDDSYELILNFVKKKLDITDSFEKIKPGDIIKLPISVKDLNRNINHNSSHFLAYLLGDDSFEADVEIDLAFKDFEIEISRDDSLNNEPADVLLQHNFLKISLGKQTHYFTKSSIKNNEVFISSIIQNYITECLFNKFYHINSIFLPPSRAALIGASFSTAKNVTTSAGMYNEFLKDLERLLEPTPTKFYPDKSIISMMEVILGGKIINEKGSLYYEFKDKRIPITAAASSIKELTPLFLLLNKAKPSEFSVLLEEPEAHIHPSLQIKVADMLCKLVNEGAFFQVTTHSDYFLNQINNSINLFNLKTKLKDKYKDFCKENELDENKILDPKKLGAYYFERRKDGSVEIKTQNVTEGVPFDTFEKSVDTIMRDSAIIENQLEELLD